MNNVLSWTRWSVLILIGLSLSGCNFMKRAPNPSLTTPAHPLILKVDTGIETMLSPQEIRILAKAEKQALDFASQSEPVRWSGKKNGRSGEIAVMPIYRVGRASCRRMIHTLEIDGKSRKSEATACRRGDNDWALLS